MPVDIPVVSDGPRDRREQDALTAEVREVNRRLVLATLRERELTARAEAASQAKSLFLATMSHELRTPLNAIIGYTSLLQEAIWGPVQEEQRTKLAKILMNAQHLLALIEEVLLLTRMDAGSEIVSWERVDGTLLLDEAAVLTMPMAVAKDLAYHVEGPESPLLLCSERRKILQILINVVENAIKFTEQGSITLRAWQQDEEVRFAVSDTGVGIPPKHLEHIFDAFWQVQQGSTRQKGGAGLGLSVSRQLAQLLGGDLTVQSTPGAGTTFTLVLPTTRLGRGAEVDRSR